MIQFIKELLNPELKCQRVGHHDHSFTKVHQQNLRRLPTEGERQRGITMVDYVRYKCICTVCSKIEDTWSSGTELHHFDFRMNEDEYELIREQGYVILDEQFNQPLELL